jgi:hypothetical protein
VVDHEVAHLLSELLPGILVVAEVLPGDDAAERRFVGCWREALKAPGDSGRWLKSAWAPGWLGSLAVFTIGTQFGAETVFDGAETAMRRIGRVSLLWEWGCVEDYYPP